MKDDTDERRALDWATLWADSCERHYGGRLCRNCIAQGRAGCALADYARRLIAERYGGVSPSSEVDRP
jgi:hypothetical protein